MTRSVQALPLPLAIDTKAAKRPQAMARGLVDGLGHMHQVLEDRFGDQLVLRTIPANDRRSALVSLTPAGRQLYDALMPQIQAINSQILKALQPDEAARFDEALERLQARAETLVTELSPDLPKANRRQGQRGKESV